MAAITDLQRLPLNLPDFIALRECGMIYVDKTRQIASPPPAFREVAPDLYF